MAGHSTTETRTLSVTKDLFWNPREARWESALAPGRPARVTWLPAAPPRPAAR